MSCNEKVKEFCVTLVFLIGYLIYRMLLFAGMLSICIGLSVLVSQSYVYFNRVKLSTSFQTFMSIGCLILFSFCGSPCSSAGARARVRQHPFMLYAIPHLIYIAIYFYAFIELIYLYMEVHSLPLGITNDAMYIINDHSTNSSRFRNTHYQNRHKHLQAVFDDEKTTTFKSWASENDSSKKITEALIERKNWDTAFFLLNFVYIIYVTCRVVLQDLEKNIPDDPSGSVKQIVGYLIMTCAQLVMLFVYSFIVGISSLLWTTFCEDPRQCLLITLTFAIFVGIIGGFVESGKPWPKKRETNEPVDPFGWFENLLRARFTILITLFALVNWSFFEDRQGASLMLTETSFLIYIVMIVASVIQVTKMFSIIAIKRAEKVISAYRLIVAAEADEHQELARNFLNADAENPPDAPPVHQINIELETSSCIESSSWETIEECTTTDESTLNDHIENRRQEALNNNAAVVNLNLDVT